MAVNYLPPKQAYITYFGMDRLVILAYISILVRTENRLELFSLHILTPGSLEHTQKQMPARMEGKYTFILLPYMSFKTPHGDPIIQK